MSPELMVVVGSMMTTPDSAKRSRTRVRRVGVSIGPASFTKPMGVGRGGIPPTGGCGKGGAGPIVVPGGEIPVVRRAELAAVPDKIGFGIPSNSQVWSITKFFLFALSTCNLRIL